MNDFLGRYVQMKSVYYTEREENFNTVEQEENTTTTEVEMEDFQKSSKKQKQSHGNIYSCDQCEFTGSKSGLRYHKQSIHEGIRYPCDQCEYVASSVLNLKRHKESKHEGVRYTCDQCEFAATTENNLKQHKESKHEGVRYPCGQCEYVATQLSSLKRHTKRKHSGECSKKNKPRIRQTVFIEASNISDKGTGIEEEEITEDPLSLTNPAGSSNAQNEYENIIVTPNLFLMKQEPI